MRNQWFIIQTLSGQEHKVKDSIEKRVKTDEMQGVIGFLSDPPQPTPTDEVEAIKAQISASEETEKPKVNFAVGETIKINNGPFLNFSGVIEEIDPERGKLKVTVNIFGRNTPVELEYWQVEKT